MTFWNRCYESLSCVGLFHEDFVAKRNFTLKNRTGEVVRSVFSFFRSCNRIFSELVQFSYQSIWATQFMPFWNQALEQSQLINWFQPIFIQFPLTSFPSSDYLQTSLSHKIFQSTRKLNLKLRTFYSKQSPVCLSLLKQKCHSCHILIKMFRPI